MKIRRPKTFSLLNSGTKIKDFNLLYSSSPNIFTSDDLCELSTNSATEVTESCFSTNSDLSLNFKNSKNIENVHLSKVTHHTNNSTVPNTQGFLKSRNYKFNSDKLIDEIAIFQISDSLAKIFQGLNIGDGIPINVKRDSNNLNTQKDNGIQPSNSGNGKSEKINNQKECEGNVAKNRFMNPKTPDSFQQNQKSATTNFIRPKDLNLINHILEIIRIFHFNLKSKDTIQMVEYTVLENKECFCYHYNLFSDEMKEFVPSTDFIFNTEIKTKSGSLLFYTFDFKFAIKTVRKSELQTAIDYIQLIYKHYEKNQNSLIVPIIGIFSTPLCYFIVMKNIFDNPYDNIFDMKGENVWRRGSSHSCIQVEKDWKETRLRVENKQEIIEAFKKDSEFLQSLELMDYSLIIGITLNNNNEFRKYNSKGKDLGKIPLNNEKITQSYGIVDVLTVYDWKKKLEHLIYKICCCGDVSCVDPEKYSKRFEDLVTRKIFSEEDE